MTISLRWLPNAICVVRVLLVAPIVSLLLDQRFGSALALIAVAGASDALDGFLAKTFDWRTRLGSLLDPAADKILVVSVFLSLTYLGLVPVVLTAIVILRDIVIVLVAFTYQFLIGPVKGEPSAISKLNTASQLCFVLFAIAQAEFGWPPRISMLVLGAAVVFTSITSGLYYVISWTKRAWRESRS